MKRRIYKGLLLLAITSFLAACKNDGDSNALSCSKPVNSVWNGTNVSLILDLSDFELNQTDTAIFTLATGEECTAIGKIEGDECSGTFIINSSQYTGGGSGDPGCADLVGTDRYTIEGSKMTACDSADENACNSYK